MYDPDPPSTGLQMVLGDAAINGGVELRADGEHSTYLLPFPF